MKVEKNRYREKHDDIITDDIPQFESSINGVFINKIQIVVNKSDLNYERMTIYSTKGKNKYNWADIIMKNHETTLILFDI